MIKSSKAKKINEFINNSLLTIVYKWEYEGWNYSNHYHEEGDGLKRHLRKYCQNK